MRAALYRVVTGPISFGPGTMLSLDRNQFTARREFVTCDDGFVGGARIRVVTRVAQAFKSGEVVGIVGDVPTPFVARVELVGEDDASEAVAAPRAVPRRKRKAKKAR